MDHGLRRTRLASRLAELGADAFLITRLPNVRYLTGFTGSNGQVLLTPGDAVFFTDGRYTEQARREVPDIERVTYLDRFLGPVVEAARRLDVGRLGFESEGVSFGTYQDLRAAAKGMELVPAGGEVERQRWVKDADELAALDRAQGATDDAFDAIVGRLGDGVTERELAFDLEAEMRRAGAERSAFDTIVAFGPNSAEPHHEPTDRALARGDVVKMDFGALVGRVSRRHDPDRRVRRAARRAPRRPRSGPKGTAGGDRRGACGGHRSRGRRRGPFGDRGCRAMASTSPTGSATAWGSRSTRGRAFAGGATTSLPAGPW